MRDFYNSIGVGQLLDPISISATTTSGYVDLLNCIGALITVPIGVGVGLSVGVNGITPKLQECATTVGSSFTDVASGDLLGAFTIIDTDAKDETVQKVGYIGSERYLRIVLTELGTVTSLVIACVVLGNYRRHQSSAAALTVGATT